MSEERPRFPEYGEGGDYIGARRARRSFRFAVAASVVFTLSLAFAELYLQQNLAERLYTHSLLLPDESARVYLLNAVKHDEQTREAPTPKYLQALALREEAPRVLERYEQAFEADDTNAAVALQYGCQLLQAGRLEEAVEKFEVAAESAPQSALPLYLKAAAQPGGLEDRDRLSESLALVAQTNSGGKRVGFPRPLWSSELPTEGRVYASLCRRMVDECASPLYAYADGVIGEARKAIEAGQTQYWDSWLVTLQGMGERLMLSASNPAMGPDGPMAGGAILAIEGIRIQLAALEQRQAIVQMGGAPPNDELSLRRARLEKALEPLLAFENARDEWIAVDRRGYLFPWSLSGATLAAVALVYVAGRLAWTRWGRRIATAPVGEGGGARPERNEAGEEPERTIRHTWPGRMVLGIGFGVLVLTLLAMVGFQRSRIAEPEWTPAVTLSWAVELGLLFLFGLVYPRLALPSAQDASRRRSESPEESEETLRLAQRLRRRAGLCLIHRYYGLLAGLVVMAFCVWVIGYRISLGLYPWQTPLLTTGLIAEEAAVVARALGMLG